MKSGDLMKVSCFAFVWAFASASSPNQMSQEGFERSTMMKEHDAFFMADVSVLVHPWKTADNYFFNSHLEA